MADSSDDPALQQRAAEIVAQLRSSKSPTDRNVLIWLAAREVGDVYYADHAVGALYPQKGRTRTQAARRTVRRMVELGILDKGMTPLGRQVRRVIAEEAP